MTIFHQFITESPKNGRKTINKGPFFFGCSKESGIEGLIEFKKTGEVRKKSEAFFFGDYGFMGVFVVEGIVEDALWVYMCVWRCVWGVYGVCVGEV